MNKIDFYRLLNEQASAIISDEPDIIANMSNLSPLLFDALDDINWVGFYRVIDHFKGR